MSVEQDALSLWGLSGAQTTLIAARENAVYRVDAPSGPLALRLHRQGYRSSEQLSAELDWMAWVSDAGLSVPAPIASKGGAHLRIVGSTQVDMLTWLSGEPLDHLLPGMDAAERSRTFNTLGRDMARLHEASDAWPGAKACNRPAWDAEGLLGETPLWDRFWDNPGLTPDQKTLLLNFRTYARSNLTDLGNNLDYGLIHADLVPANVMKDGEALHFIDFDDGGYGFRLFEVATALLKHRAEPDFETLKAELLDGYRSQRPLDVLHLDLFLALRAMTYVGWNITRADEDELGARNERFINQALDCVQSFRRKSRKDKRLY